MNQYNKRAFLEHSDNYCCIADATRINRLRNTTGPLLAIIGKGGKLSISA